MANTPRTQSALLDHFSIFTNSGLVLWSRTFASANSGTSTGLPAFDSMIKEKIIDTDPLTQTAQQLNHQEAETNIWEGQGCTVRWVTENVHGLIFAVAYPRILTLAYIPTLLSTIKQLFVSLFEPLIQALIAAISGQDMSQLPLSVKKKLFSPGGWQNIWKGWEETFIETCIELQGRQPSKAKTSSAIGKGVPQTKPSEPRISTNGSTDPVADAELISRNVSAFKARQKSRVISKKKGGKGLGVETDETAGSETDSSIASGRKPTVGKERRKWGDSKVDATDMAALDFSPSSTPTKKGQTKTDNFLDRSALGSKDKQGFYTVADYQTGTKEAEESDDDEELAAFLDSNKAAKQSAFSTLLSRISESVGLASRPLTAADLAPALAAMTDQLLNKNVAREVTDAIVKAVGTSLVGVSVRPGGRGLRKAVKTALSDSLTRILTPRTSTDILHEIQRKKNKPVLSFGSTSGKDPYALTFVGVNGVGKSTNLSKVAFWLLQNDLKVLIAACDTFRSGAVEQLRVHVRNLEQLQEGENRVELYEKGYGKDAAGIAKEAIAYAKQKNFDVVLIDTAGRMQDNEPLMRALAKLVAVNRPDKIIFVGEALVGNEAVDQLVKFNTSLRDFSSASGAAPRGIDGIILTKFDTIDDKVGAAVSMTYVTGQPLLFVGTGQTYSDLRSLRVAHIVNALLA